MSRYTNEQIESANIAAEDRASAERARQSGPAKDTRITLNITPDLYKELIRWADSAAVAIDVPRVGVQDVLRAMIRGTLDSTPATDSALKALRNERQRSTAS